MRHILLVSLGLLLFPQFMRKCRPRRFERCKHLSPKWQEVSQQYAFVKRNLETALVLYEENLEDLEPQIEQASASRRPELIGLRGRYQTMVREAQELQGDYKEQYAELKETVISFNEWAYQAHEQQVQHRGSSCRFCHL